MNTKRAIAHSPSLLLAALLIGPLAGRHALAQGVSTAHESRAPEFIHDGVPAEPPTLPGPGPEPAVTTVRNLSGITFIRPEPGETWYDGEQTPIQWAAGPRIAEVRFYFYGDKCELGSRARGAFDGIINGGLIPNTGETTWEPPWLDATALNLRVAAYDEGGGLVAVNERRVRLLPREFMALPADCTCIAVSKRRQRLYYFKDGETKRMHIVSTAARGYTTPRMKPGSHDRRRGQMGKVFRKAYRPFSRRYEVHMPYWLGITSSGSHGIHATSPNLYWRLGSPASHGCIRQHRADARILYNTIRVGTPVYVF